MKVISYFLFFACSTFTVNAQQFAVVKGTIISDKPVNISVYKPINGFFNDAFYKSEGSPLITQLSQETIAFQDSVQGNNPCFVTIYLTSTDGDFLGKSNILVSFNDTVEVQFNLKASTVEFTGNNAKGHKLFYDLTDNPGQVSIPADNIISLFPGNRNTFAKELIDYGDKLSKPFEQLLNKGLITQQYYNTISDNLHLWPINMAVGSLLFGTKRGTVIQQQVIDSTIESIYKIYPPSKKYHMLLIASSYYNNFQAFQAYKMQHLVSPKIFYSSDSVLVTKTGKQYLINKEFVRFLYIKDPDIRQNEWGNLLTDLLSCTQGFIDLNTIKQYEELNPNTHWSKILRRQYAAFQTSSTELFNLSQPIVEIGDSVVINTFAELVKKLPESNFYFVDIWASWCGPCIKAFSANTYIDSVLNINHITKVYVSLDRNVEVWEKATVKYALGGYNVKANDSMVIDIKEMLGIDINGPLSIPCYMLINSKGELVKELYSPVTRSKLAEQIKELILKNK